MTLPVNTTVTEPKVKVAAITAYLAGAVMSGLAAALQDGNFVAFLPDAISPFVLPVIPAVLTWIAAYRAKHQFRAGENVVTP